MKANITSGSLTEYNTLKSIYNTPQNSNYIELGEDKVTDYSSAVGFNKNIHYTDCKVAYSEPEQIEISEEK